LSGNSASKVWDCKIIATSILSDEQRLDAMLNFAKYNPVDTYYFPTKVEYEKTNLFSTVIYKILSLAGIFC